MKNIQYLADNNQVVSKQIVKGCVQGCTQFEEGEELIIATIPKGALVTCAYIIVTNPKNVEVKVEVDLGILDIGHNFAQYAITANRSKSYTLPIDPITMQANENVLVRLEKALDKYSSVCVFVEFIQTEIITGDVVSEEPSLCDCVGECNVYAIGA